MPECIVCIEVSSQYCVMFVFSMCVIQFVMSSCELE